MTIVVGPLYCSDTRSCSDSLACRESTTSIPNVPVGVPSAQAFGTITIKTAIRVTVMGVGSAQAFGTPAAIRAGAPQTVVVPGVPSPAQFGTPTGPVPPVLGLGDQGIAQLVAAVGGGVGV